MNKISCPACGFALMLLFFMFSCSGRRQHDVEELFARAARWEEAGRLDSALVAYQNALRELENTDDDAKRGEAHLAIGGILVKSFWDREAFSEFAKAYQCSKDLEDKSIASKALVFMGNYHIFYGKKGKMESTKQHGADMINRTLRFLPQVDKETRAIIYHNVAYVHYENEDYRRAWIYAAMSDFCTEDSALLHRNEHTRCLIYLKTGRNRQAIESCQAMLTYPDPYLQASACTVLIRAFGQLDDREQSRNYSQRLDSLISGLSYNKEEILAIWQQGTEPEGIPFRYWVKDLWVFLVGGIALLIFYFVAKRKAGSQGQPSGFSDFPQENLDKENLVAQFYATEIGRKVLQIKEDDEAAKRGEALNNSLCNGDLDLLSQTLQQSFPVCCQKLLRIYPDIVPKDLSYCCLSGLLGLSSRCCAACLGLSSDSIRTNKMRIKKKLCVTPGGKELFEQMFPS